MPDILLVEDQADLRTILKIRLIKEKHRVDEAEDLKTAAFKLEQGRYDVIILDLKLPDGESISLFDRFPEQLADRTIMITANASVPSVVEAIKKGAYNYLEKPVNKDILVDQVKAVAQLQKNKQKGSGGGSAGYNFDDLVFKSSKMTEAVERAKVLAQTLNTVLIQGETGCGKELFAHSIHNLSERRNQIFLPVNCASIPEDLFETELFGYDKGAFTGASGDYRGRFIQAHNGTLFLDEIGELPMHIQAKLLRVLDDHVVYPLKSNTPVTVDVRLVAATNRDLFREVEEKKFRNDLYYRLIESSILIPPLRERAEDVLPLVYHFINQYNGVYNKNVTRVSAEAETYFMGYTWDGNVRELKNTVKSIIPFKTDNTISMDDLSFSLMQRGDGTKNKAMTLEETEKNHIYNMLKLNDFNILRTAELLGISRPRLYRKIKEYGLQVNGDPTNPGKIN